MLLIQADPRELDSVRTRAKRSCIAFPDQPMPAPSVPTHGRVGVEVRSSGRAVLLVDRGIRYAGSDAELQAWLTSGKREFASFDELTAWVRGPWSQSVAAVGGVSQDG